MDSTAETGISMEIPEERLISMVSLVGSEVWTRRIALDWGLAASLRFHWWKNVGQQLIDLQNCEIESIGSFAPGDPFGPNFGGFR